MISRRHLVAGAASFPLAMPIVNGLAQSSTPVATPSRSTAPTTYDVLPAWLDAQESLRELGETASHAFWESDMETLLDVSDDMMKAALESGLDINELLQGYTQNQIQFAFRESGAWFFGQYTPEMIAGIFSQNGPVYWQATPSDPQASDYPTGKWVGIIGPGIVNLEIELEFTGDSDSLDVALTIPLQMVQDHPMTDVLFAPEIPVGERSDTRIMPVGGHDLSMDFYAEQFEWGSHTLMLLLIFGDGGKLAGINFVPQGTLPEVETPAPIMARLPFDGAWMVFWGGDTEFRNYHAVAPSQRFAADLMIWQDGATAVSPGSENENYHAFGQPYLAPIDGTVAFVLNDQEDVPPQQPGQPGVHPAGNHVVIESDGGFVYLAHCKAGSILVREGDIVSAGDVVAAVGNSGNTSESHVHIHAQTHLDMYDPEVAGIPIVFEGAMENGKSVEQLSLIHGTIVEHIS